MALVVIRPQAEEDLYGIWWHIATESSDPDTADRFLDKIRQRIEKIADFPLSGRHRPELHPNLRSVLVSGYLIFYYPVQNGIRIVRVLHGSMDLTAQEYEDVE